MNGPGYKAIVSKYVTNMKNGGGKWALGGAKKVVKNCDFLFFGKVFRQGTFYIFKFPQSPKGYVVSGGSLFFGVPCISKWMYMRNLTF